MVRNRLPRRLLLLCGFFVWLSGCASNPRSGSAWRDAPHDPGPLSLPPAAAVPCGQPASGRADGGVLRLSLPGAVDPLAAPLPTSEAERHVFASLYETLVRVDCDGQVAPGLARRWRAYDGGRVWLLELRPGARFWDGTPVTPGAVAAAWRRARTLCYSRGEPDPFLLFSPAALESPAPGELLIRLRTASDELPLHLTHPALAVAGEPGAGGWPAGSGPCRPSGPVVGGSLTLLPAENHPQPPRWERLEVRLGDPRDPREFLDTGGHVLVTRDRDVRDYYEARRGARVVSLPWNRWYYLVASPTGPGVDQRERRRWTSGWDRLELAREVATDTAEPAEFFAYPPPLRACAAIPPEVPIWPRAELDPDAARGQRDADLVLWPAGDAEAGRLADRLAAVAARPLRPGPDLPGRGPLTPPVAPPPGVAPVAGAVPGPTLPAHVQAARAGAVVLPWPRRFPTPCAELARLLSLADWLQGVALDPGIDADALPEGARAARPLQDREPVSMEAIARRLERADAVQPLIRTRAHVILGGGVDGPAWGHDGALQLGTLGLRRP